MSTSYFDYNIDPADNTIYPYTFRSASKGGGGSGIVGIGDLTIPSAANFPSTNTTYTATRYFIQLPGDVYRTSTNSSEFTVTNETQSRDLVIIEPTATLTDYTCKLYSVGSDKKSILEAHVGSTSSLAGDTLSIQGKFSGCVISSTTFDGLKSTAIDTSIVMNSNIICSTYLTVKQINSTASSYINIEKSIRIANYITGENSGAQGLQAFGIVTNSVVTESGVEINGYSLGGAAIELNGAFESTASSNLNRTLLIVNAVKSTDANYTGWTANFTPMYMRNSGNTYFKDGVVLGYNKTTYVLPGSPTNNDWQLNLGASTGKITGSVFITGDTSTSYMRIVATDGTTSYWYVNLTKAT